MNWIDIMKIIKCFLEAKKEKDESIWSPSPHIIEVHKKISENETITKTIVYFDGKKLILKGWIPAEGIRTLVFPLKEAIKITREAIMSNKIPDECISEKIKKELKLLL